MQSIEGFRDCFPLSMLLVFCVIAGGEIIMVISKELESKTQSKGKGDT